MLHWLLTWVNVGSKCSSISNYFYDIYKYCNDISSNYTDIILTVISFHFSLERSEDILSEDEMEFINRVKRSNR